MQTNIIDDNATLSHLNQALTNNSMILSAAEAVVKSDLLEKGSKRKKKSKLLPTRKTIQQPKLCVTGKDLLKKIAKKFEAMSSKEKDIFVKKTILPLVKMHLAFSKASSKAVDSSDQYESSIPNILMVLAKVFCKSMDVQSMNELAEMNDVKIHQDLLQIQETKLQGLADKAKDSQNTPKKPWYKSGWFISLCITVAITIATVGIAAVGAPCLTAGVEAITAAEKAVEDISVAVEDTVEPLVSKAPQLLEETNEVEITEFTEESSELNPEDDVVEDDDVVLDEEGQAPNDEDSQIETKDQLNQQKQTQQVNEEIKDVKNGEQGKNSSNQTEESNESEKKTYKTQAEKDAAKKAAVKAAKTAIMKAAAKKWFWRVVMLIPVGMGIGQAISSGSDTGKQLEKSNEIQTESAAVNIRSGNLNTDIQSDSKRISNDAEMIQQEANIIQGAINDIGQVMKTPVR